MGGLKRPQQRVVVVEGSLQLHNSAVSHCVTAHLAQCIDRPGIISGFQQHPEMRHLLDSIAQRID